MKYREKTEASTGSVQKSTYDWQQHKNNNNKGKILTTTKDMSIHFGIQEYKAMQVYRQQEKKKVCFIIKKLTFAHWFISKSKLKP